MFFRSLLTEYRSHRMARYTAWILAYGLALWVMDRASPGSASPRLILLLWLLLVPSGGYYLYRLGRYVKLHFLWRLRRRLVLTYFFIAFVPIALIVVLVGFGAYILSGQYASFVVASRLRGRADELLQLSRVVTHGAMDLSQSSPRVLLDAVQSFFQTNLAEYAPLYPDLAITASLGNEARAFYLDGRPGAESITFPPWLKREEFSGIVLDGKELALRAVDQHRVSGGHFRIIVSEPFSSALLDRVGAGVGPVGILSRRPSSEPGAAGAARPSETITLRSASVPMPDPVNRFDYAVRNLASLDPIRWQGDEGGRDQEAGLFYVTTRLVTLNRQMLANLGRFSDIYWSLFAVLGIVFLLLEIVAAVIGWQLTRSITNTVDRLQEGTERVRVGDFSYRIGLPARDQLTALGEAFDGMTASVERLLRESLEKTRLEGELAIAHEVQRQLFPKGPPLARGLSVYGACKAARTVSGDYYDFLQLGQSHLGLALGDISGKGISAALLMASVQSSLRAQFYNGQSGEPVQSAHQSISTAAVVARLNRQLYACTPQEKYATFFYGVYEGDSRLLTYTTAGHPPPFLFRQGRVDRLATGGTVLGLFASVGYEQGVVQLDEGDVLLAYTDGITEPENTYGEEFGEERLLEVAQRALNYTPEMMAEEIYRTVSDWTGSPELQDDMTLLVAKAHAG